MNSMVIDPILDMDHWTGRRQISIIKSSPILPLNIQWIYDTIVQMYMCTVQWRGFRLYTIQVLVEQDLSQIWLLPTVAD